MVQPRDRSRPPRRPRPGSLEAAAAPADTEYIYYVLTRQDGRRKRAASRAHVLRAKKKSKEVVGW